jgi:hypothetical protein
MKALLTPLAICALAAGPAALAQSTPPPAKPEAAAPAAPAAPAQTPPAGKDAAPADGKFDAAHLEQIVAPVALYPDSLLMQVFMASTYPLEIVEAARWVKDNPKVTGEAVDAAIKEEDWDPSVKSLCRLPEVLAKMNENLDWTRDMGDAFLGQQTEMLDAVQRLRQKAQKEGHLKSSKEQTVTVQEDKTIIIKESDPEIIYVPSYNPTVVYGPTWPPPVYYAPMYVYPPGAAFFTFSVGFAMGAAMWGGCNWGWGHSDVDINVNNYNNFNRNTNINSGNTSIGNNSGNRTKWEHNPEHRKGVNYKSADTAQRFGGSGSGTRVSQADARGRGGSSGAANRAATPSTRDAGGARGGGTSRPSAQTGSRQGASRDSAFSGAGNSSFDRAASQRGASSRGGHSGGSRSGASRGGGGRGGGGGRRR